MSSSTLTALTVTRFEPDDQFSFRRIAIAVPSAPFFFVETLLSECYSKQKEKHAKLQGAWPVGVLTGADQ